MSIVKSTRKDLPRVAKLFFDHLQPVSRRVVIDTLLTREGTYIFNMENRIVGFYNAVDFETGARVLWLDYIAVDPKYRKHGVGTRLLEHLERVADEMGYESIELSVEIHNSKARSVYEKCGYRPSSAQRLKGRLCLAKGLRSNRPYNPSAFRLARPTTGFRTLLNGLQKLKLLFLLGLFKAKDSLKPKVSRNQTPLPSA